MILALAICLVFWRILRQVWSQHETERADWRMKEENLLNRVMAKTWADFAQASQSMVVHGADGPPVGTSQDLVEMKRAGLLDDFDPENMDRALGEMDAILGNADRTIGAD